MEDLPRFTYQRLTDPTAQTRVLVIFPGPPEAPLRIGIDVMRLGAQNTINFDALSYTWGNATPDTEVEIGLKSDPESLNIGSDGTSGGRASHSHGAPQTTHKQELQNPGSLDPLALVEHHFPIRRKIKISSNLERGLRHIRRPNEGWYAWADGICINQGDDEEKSQQVRRMDLVYKGAKYVSIWLGERTEESDLATDLLQKYSTYQRREGAWCRDRDIDEERFLQDTRSWANHWEAFRKLLERPWFRRRWIIQEAVLAKSPVISCGDRVLSWCDLAQVSEILLKASKSGFFDPVSQELHATIHLVSSNHDIRTFVEEDRQSPELALHQMCARFFSSRCYDPRDIVYSLLSLIHDSDRQRIIPDYSSNTKVEDVFVQCFRIIVDNAQSLNFIFRAKHPPTEDLTGAETWLPCLGAYSREGSCRCGEHGTAEGIYKSLPRPEFRASLSTTPEYCIEKTDGKYTLVASGHLYCPIFYVGNGKAELNEDADFAVFLDQIDAEKEIAQFNETWKDISPRVNHLPLTAGQWAAFSNGPAQKGDIICLLLGCSSPAILRPFAPGIPEYYLISAQQVNGIMQGEFMDLCIKKDMTPQKFRIR